MPRSDRPRRQYRPMNWNAEVSRRTPSGQMGPSGGPPPRPAASSGNNMGGRMPVLASVSNGHGLSGPTPSPLVVRRRSRRLPIALGLTAVTGAGAYALHRRRRGGNVRKSDYTVLTDLDGNQQVFAKGHPPVALPVPGSRPVKALLPTGRHVSHDNDLKIVRHKPRRKVGSTLRTYGKKKGVSSGAFGKGLRAGRLIERAGKYRSDLNAGFDDNARGLSRHAVRNRAAYFMVGTGAAGATALERSDDRRRMKRIESKVGKSLYPTEGLFAGPSTPLYSHSGTFMPTSRVR